MVYNFPLNERFVSWVKKCKEMLEDTIFESVKKYVDENSRITDFEKQYIREHEIMRSYKVKSNGDRKGGLPCFITERMMYYYDYSSNYTEDPLCNDIDYSLLDEKGQEACRIYSILSSMNAEFSSLDETKRGIYARALFLEQDDKNDSIMNLLQEVV